MFEQSPKTVSLSRFLRLATTRPSRTQGFLSLLLLEDYINTSIPSFRPSHYYIIATQLMRSTYIHTYRHWRLLEPKKQISCLNQKVYPNLSFCKCFEAFWRAYSKLDFSTFQKPVGRGVCMSETTKHVCMSEISKRACMYVSGS